MRTRASWNSNPPPPRHSPARPFLPHAAAAALAAAMALAPANRLRADEVRMQIGDHYAGKVLLLNTNSLILQSEVMGKVTLPRSRVAAITLSSTATNADAASNLAARAPLSDTPPPAGDLANRLRTDEVRMENGDRLAAKVLLLNADSLVLQSEVLGKVTLPRCRVATITLFSTATNAAPANVAAGTPSANGPPLDANLPPTLRQFAGQASSIGDVKNQLLKDANPEATKRFNDMVTGLMTGKLSVNDIRAQAQSVAAQARALKRDLGDDPAALALDSYLQILDDFLQQTAPSSPGTNTAKASKSTAP